MDQPSPKRRPMSALRRMMLFGVGTVLIAEEEIKAFAERAIAKGKEAQEQGKKLVQEKRAERREKEQEVQETLDTRLDETLERLNLCSQRDVEQLQQQVTELLEKLNELQAAE